MKKYSNKALATMARQFMDAQNQRDRRCDALVLELQVRLGLSKSQVLTKIYALSWVQ